MKKEKIAYAWKDRKRFLGLPLSFTRYMLSEDRLFLSKGFLNVTDDEILLYRVRDISTSRNLFQRLLGVGTVTILSSDKTCPAGAEECEKPHRREGAAPQERGGDEAAPEGPHQRADQYGRQRRRLLLP